MAPAGVWIFSCAINMHACIDRVAYGSKPLMQYLISRLKELVASEEEISPCFEPLAQLSLVLPTM